jgi:23S rRNA maturation-related 3'-5' exoribonuclease YhaM
MEDKILLEMQQQLGRIEASITAVKEDISELKQKDLTQSENLEKAYAKAKARQDLSETTCNIRLTDKRP